VGDKKKLMVNIKKLFTDEPLEEKDCLNINQVIGLGALGLLILFLNPKFKPFLPQEFMYGAITIAFLLIGCSLFAKYNVSLTKQILLVQGVVICLFIPFYVYSMLFFINLVKLEKIRIGIAHTPGILAIGALYGAKQVVDFFWKSNAAVPIILKKLPFIFLISGAGCDGMLIYFMSKNIFH